VLLPHWILFFFGVKALRIIFVFGHFMNLFKAFVNRENHLEDLRSEINGRLNTRRIKRIFKEIMDEAKHPALSNSE